MGRHKQRHAQRHGTVQTFHQQSLQVKYSGPLPHPSDLDAYSRIFPGCAERIVTLSETQSAHRQRLESSVVEANILAQRSGARFGFVLALLVIVGGFGLIAAGKDAQGIGLIVGDAVALSGAFLIGRRQQERERQRNLQRAE
jgi:uncharacterized membrane protein